MTTPDADENDRHLNALARARQAGFISMPLVDANGVGLKMLHGERWRDGALDAYTVTAADEAFAARYRAPGVPEDFDADPEPIWYATGTVEEVITQLLELPPHGSPGAPTHVVAAPLEVWLPPTAPRRGQS